MTRIVIFGAGMIADTLHSLLSGDPRISIAGFACDREFVTGAELHGLPLVAFDEVEAAFPPAEFGMLVAVGYQDINALRAARCCDARAKGYRLVSWVSPQAHAPQSCAIGENCVVMDGASLQPYSRLGDGVFVWSGAVVGHHSAIGDYGWLASNCTIAGKTTLEPCCFVGVNAAIGQGITIGASTIVGAGTIITHSTEPNGVYIASDTERYRLSSQQFNRIARIL